MGGKAVPRNSNFEHAVCALYAFMHATQVLMQMLPESMQEVAQRQNSSPQIHFQMSKYSLTHKGGQPTYITACASLRGLGTV